jgi:hypothetical protein
MHKMSFEIGKGRAPATRKPNLLPAILLFAFVVSLAWAVEPMLAGFISGR